jgi:hypothetical protein
MPGTSDGLAAAIQPSAPLPPVGAASPKAGWLTRTHCRVIGHTGDWTYPDGRCVRVRMCQRCGEVTSKQEHTWSPFEYLAAKQCEQERRCERCDAVESRVQHNWGPWRYASEHDTRQSTTCRRCGAETRTRSGSTIW